VTPIRPAKLALGREIVQRYNAGNELPGDAIDVVVRRLERVLREEDDDEDAN
jgi:hypothetical protein